jgi:hypothetical protein
MARFIGTKNIKKAEKMFWSNFDIFSKFTLLLLCASFANSYKGFDDTILYKINWDELEDNGQKV